MSDNSIKSLSRGQIPQDGDILIYDATTESWIPNTPSWTDGDGSAAADNSIKSLGVGNIPIDGDILRFDAATDSWKPFTTAEIDTASTSDEAEDNSVKPLGKGQLPLDGDVLAFDAASNSWLPRTASAPAPMGYVSTKSIQFDGNDDFANRADAAAHDFSTKMSLSIWVKGAGNANYGGIAVKHDYGSSENSYALLDSGVVQGMVGCFIFDDGNAGSGAKQWHSSITALDNTWHHVVFTFNAGTFKIYIDRVQDTNPTKVADDTVLSIKDSALGLRIGSQINGGTPANFFGGEANNLSLWDTDLSQSQINELATSSKPADLSTHSLYATNCKAWYKLGDGDTIGAGGILDSTANALHLSPTNMVSGAIVTDAP